VKITWAEQKDDIVTKLLSALRKLVDKRYKVTNKELLEDVGALTIENIILEFKVKKK